MVDQKITEEIQIKVAQLLQEMTLDEKIALTIGRDFWHTNGVERLAVEPISLTDGPHGIRKAVLDGAIGIGHSIPATCFPTAVSLAASWDIELVEEVGQALGEEALALDVQVLLGPGVNIKRTPLGGRNFEYFSEDPLLAGELATAWVRGVQAKGVGASLKHYACNNQEWERMTINAEVDQRTLREIYLAAFERVVKRTQPWTIMSSYNKVNGAYASEHPQLLNEILKQEWKFEGVVVSDWGAVNDKAKALLAGLDLEMPGPLASHAEKIAQLVRDGAIPAEVIDSAVERVLTLIQQGLSNRRPGFEFDREAHHALARRGAAESIVLLKNVDGFLPLAADKLEKVVVLGQFAKTPRYQGAGSSQVVPTQLDSTLSELAGWLGDKVKLVYAEGYSEAEQPDEGLIKEAVELALASSVAIVFAGLPDSFESEGFDRAHLFMPESHNRLIEEVCKVQPNTLVVLHNGSVVAMPWLDGPRAIVEAGLGGQAIGSAIVDVLSGKVNPSGKLAETFPIRLEDSPAYINYPGELGTVRYGEGVFVGYRYYEKKKLEPLFPFGYGLSYTTFEYSDLKTNKGQFQVGETLEVTFTVRNSGKQAGKEVVQLYVQPLKSAYARPIKELKAFAKVSLEPGEAKEVLLRLEERDFMVYDIERQNWRLEGGSYEIVVGASSADVRLKSSLVVKEDPQSARRTFSRMSPIKYFLQDPAGRKGLEAVIAGTRAEGLLQGENEMFTSIPIIKLVGFSGLKEEVIDNLVDQLNQTRFE